MNSRIKTYYSEALGRKVAVPSETTEGECPCCYENRIDWLAWDDEEMVHCESCGNVYDPMSAEE